MKIFGTCSIPLMSNKLEQLHQNPRQTEEISRQIGELNSTLQNVSS